MTKKQAILLLIAVFTAVTLFSHPAKAIKLTFDPTMTILQISIEHDVKDVKDHFISHVAVSVNKKEVITQVFTKQESEKATEVMYKIFDAKPGDEIVVTTKCNKTGSKSEKISIPAPVTRPPIQQETPIK
jgi:hypothetical protein